MNRYCPHCKQVVRAKVTVGPLAWGLGILAALIGAALFPPLGIEVWNSGLVAATLLGLVVAATAGAVRPIYACPICKAHDTRPISPGTTGD